MFMNKKRNNIDNRRPERERRECEPTNLKDIPIIKEAGRA